MYLKKAWACAWAEVWVQQSGIQTTSLEEDYKCGAGLQIQMPCKLMQESAPTNITVEEKLIFLQACPCL